MEADLEAETSTATDLQKVLTRYVDSHDGYLQAAELMEKPELAEAFREIATKRREAGKQISGMIQSEGARPDSDGSHEGGAHRWWMRLREKLTADELQAVLAECVRGETVLVNSLESALKCPDLGADQAAALTSARDEVKAAIEHFESAIGN